MRNSTKDIPSGTSSTWGQQLVEELSLKIVVETGTNVFIKIVNSVTATTKSYAFSRPCARETPFLDLRGRLVNHRRIEASMDCP